MIRDLLWIPFWSLVAIAVLALLATMGAHPQLFAIIPAVLIGMIVCSGILVGLVVILGLIGYVGKKIFSEDEPEPVQDPKAERIAQLERRKRMLNKLRTEDKITKEMWLQETKRAQDEIDALV